MFSKKREESDIKEIAEIMKCDADAETKCKMISNILTAKPHYFEEQELCEDAISRQAVLKLFATHDGKYLYEAIRDMPSVNPQERTGHCKDCRWWKDSDGVYRRGIGVESKCPINNESVNHGLGYCYMFEPQKSE